MTDSTPHLPASDPRFPTPDPLPLPPTQRDFEIFEQNQVHFLSTRQLADKHRISQTRVRQIVSRVANWLADHLPAKTEADQQAETRLAQHLAAAQLRRQIEVLKNYFDATGDPKYIRQQTRVILSLARLGILPGAIDSLAADFSDEDSANHSPASAAPTVPCPLTPDPSLRACSPSVPATEAPTASANDSPAATADTTEASDELEFAAESQLEGLAIMERRLLTLLDQTTSDNHDRRSSLENTLQTVRRHLAAIELRLSPNHSGVSLHPCNPPHTASSSSDYASPLSTHH